MSPVKSTKKARLALPYPKPFSMATFADEIPWLFLKIMPIGFGYGQ
jgi:hypothetical protein